MIRIISSTKAGQALCPAAIIGNVHVDERRYSIYEHIVTLDGQAESVLYHDAMTLLHMPGGGYRSMMPSEQRDLQRRIEEQRTVEE